VPEKVHPHMLRHSKAMHLLESGVNLVYIRDFLGYQTREKTRTQPQPIALDLVL
jgi:site-specific recombinase XerD